MSINYNQIMIFIVLDLMFNPFKNNKIWTCKSKLYKALILKTFRTLFRILAVKNNKLAFKNKTITNSGDKIVKNHNKIKIISN
jgi:hypothetical protein